MQKLLSKNGSFVYKVFEVLKMKELAVTDLPHRQKSGEFSLSLVIVFTAVLTSLKLLSFVLYVNMFPYTHLLAIFNLKCSLIFSSSLSLMSFGRPKGPKGPARGKM